MPCQCQLSDSHLACHLNGVIDCVVLPFSVNVRRPIHSNDPRLVSLIEAGKTYMLVNFVAASLGATVSYDAKTKVVTITLKEG